MYGYIPSFQQFIQYIYITKYHTCRLFSKRHYPIYHINQTTNWPIQPHNLRNCVPFNCAVPANRSFPSLEWYRRVVFTLVERDVLVIFPWNSFLMAEVLPKTTEGFGVACPQYFMKKRCTNISVERDLKRLKFNLVYWICWDSWGNHFIPKFWQQKCQQVTRNPKELNFLTSQRNLLCLVTIDVPGSSNTQTPPHAVKRTKRRMVLRHSTALESLKIGGRLGEHLSQPYFLMIKQFRWLYMGSKRDLVSLDWIEFVSLNFGYK